MFSASRFGPEYVCLTRMVRYVFSELINWRFESMGHIFDRAITLFAEISAAIMCS